MSGRNKLVEHAKRELHIAGLDRPDADYGGRLADAVIELITVFSKQGHSGHSAAVVRSLFNKLSDFKQLAPLTFAEDEWVEYSDGLFQNTRNGCVFKDGVEGRPYFIDAYTLRSPNGSRWSGRLHLKGKRYIRRCYIKDVNYMPTVYIDIDELEVTPCNWDIRIKDEAQLEELRQFYDVEILDEAKEEQ